jgi:hypothetical protein
VVCEFEKSEDSKERERERNHNKNHKVEVASKSVSNVSSERRKSEARKQLLYPRKALVIQFFKVVSCRSKGQKKKKTRTRTNRVRVVVRAASCG